MADDSERGSYKEEKGHCCFVLDPKSEFVTMIMRTCRGSAVLALGRTSRRRTGAARDDRGGDALVSDALRGLLLHLADAHALLGLRVDVLDGLQLARKVRLYTKTTHQQKVNDTNDALSGLPTGILQHRKEQHMYAPAA
jgi:hypothetical protein